MRRRIALMLAMWPLPGLAACQTTSTRLVTTDAPSTALSMIGPATFDLPTETPGVYHLGAGDALGRALFREYVAKLEGVDGRSVVTGF